MALFGSKKQKDDNKDAKPEALKKKAAKPVKKDEEAKEAGSMKDLYNEGAPKVSKAKKGKVELKFPEASKLLVKPLVTEKATDLASNSKYVFVVDTKANKIGVAKAIQAVYGVKPVDVNIINMKGKAVSRGRIKGKRKDWKKAIVTLAKGETIAIYEGV